MQPNDKKPNKDERAVNALREAEFIVKRVIKKNQVIETQLIFKFPADYEDLFNAMIASFDEDIRVWFWHAKLGVSLADFLKIHQKKHPE